MKNLIKTLFILITLSTLMTGCFKDEVEPMPFVDTGYILHKDTLQTGTKDSTSFFFMTIKDTIEFTAVVTNRTEHGDVYQMYQWNYTITRNNGTTRISPKYTGLINAKNSYLNDSKYKAEITSLGEIVHSLSLTNNQVGKYCFVRIWEVEK